MKKVLFFLRWFCVYFAFKGWMPNYLQEQMTREYDQLKKDRNK